jgi:hypothetical protein
MALSTLVFTPYGHPNGFDNTQRRQIVRGTIAISASPGTYPTGGFSLAGIIVNEGIKSTDAVPAALYFTSVSGSGYTYVWNRANNKLQIFTGSAAQSPATELSAAATPAGVSGDVIELEAQFPRNA